MNLTVPSLLITDDDRDFSQTLQGVFEPRGIRTLLASDGMEAVEIIQREPVHLLLVDMHMPRLTGLETIHRLRTMPIVVPSILMSAALDQNIVDEAERYQVFSILSKPFPVKELMGLVSRALELHYNWHGC